MVLKNDSKPTDLKEVHKQTRMVTIVTNIMPQNLHKNSVYKVVGARPLDSGYEIQLLEVTRR